MEKARRGKRYELIGTLLVAGGLVAGMAGAHMGTPLFAGGVIVFLIGRFL